MTPFMHSQDSLKSARAALASAPAAVELLSSSAAAGKENEAPGGQNSRRSNFDIPPRKNACEF